MGFNSAPQYHSITTSCEAVSYIIALQNTLHSSTHSKVVEMETLCSSYLHLLQLSVYSFNLQGYIRDCPCFIGLVSEKPLSLYHLFLIIPLFPSEIHFLPCPNTAHCYYNFPAFLEAVLISYLLDPCHCQPDPS